MKRIRTQALHILTLLVLVASTLLATPRPVNAAVRISVTTFADEYGTGTACSLREAIRAANTDTAFGGCPKGSGTDEIILQAGYYKLTRTGANENANVTGDLDITSSMVISGSGVALNVGSLVYADAGFGDRIFHIKSPTSTKINVIFNNLRVKGGLVSLAPGGGGMLVDNANVSLQRVFVTENSVPTAISGGGITNYIGSYLYINQSTLSLNTSGHGGAVYNRGDLVIENSLLYSNTGSTGGGGIDNSADAGKSATIRNTTISANTSSEGAGIANSGSLTMVNVTMANNQGSAGLLLNSGSSLAIRNTIIARHDNGPNCTRLNTTAVFVSNGYNLVDAAATVPPGQYACGWGVNDKTGVNPQLTSSVGNYDSPTMTYGFTSTSSEAIDAIPVGNTSCPVTDQRLHGRWADGNEDGTPGCDIGAYEEGGPLLRSFMPVIMR